MELYATVAIAGLFLIASLGIIMNSLPSIIEALRRLRKDGKEKAMKRCENCGYFYDPRRKFAFKRCILGYRIILNPKGCDQFVQRKDRPNEEKPLS